MGGRDAGRIPSRAIGERMQGEKRMSEPFIFISHSKIREGKLEEFRSYVRDIAKMVETQEPRVIGFHAYANDDGTEVTGVQIHPDAASMESHMKLLRDKIGQSMQLLETSRIEIFGAASPGILAMMKQMANVPITVRPDHVGGFTRSNATE